LKTRFLLIVAIAIVAGLGGALLARNFFSTEHVQLTSGTVLEPARPLPQMQFTDQAGQPFDRARLQGRWSFLFFGFTHCPDVCPTTLTMLSTVERSLADLPRAQRPQVVLVSVDPQRDTPEKLATYVKFFNPNFVGITASTDHTQQFTQAMGVPVAIRNLDARAYTVDHSGAIFLIDPNAELRALFTPPQNAQALITDYRHLIR